MSAEDPVKQNLNIVNEMEVTYKRFMNIQNVHASVIFHNLIFFYLILHVGY